MHPARERLALRLDTDDPDAAVALAKRLAPWCGVGKVGVDLLVGGGPAVIERLQDVGVAVFVDLKLHDIPDQVEASARAIGRLGVRYVTMHAAGGEAMLRAGLAGLAAGARDADVPVPLGLAVTVLTSDPDAGAFASRLEQAVAAGCDGVVCSALEAATVKGKAPGLVVVTPGIRLGETARAADHGAGDHGAGDDQARVATPGAAVAAGADLLVVGRPITGAPDPAEVAARIADEIDAAVAAI